MVGEASWAVPAAGASTGEEGKELRISVVAVAEEAPCRRSLGGNGGGGTRA
jgi:hypothetical protein